MTRCFLNNNRYYGVKSVQYKDIELWGTPSSTCKITERYDVYYASEQTGQIGKFVVLFCKGGYWCKDIEYHLSS